jgi:hypothetical protein
MVIKQAVYNGIGISCSGTVGTWVQLYKRYGGYNVKVEQSSEV